MKRGLSYAISVVLILFALQSCNRPGDSGQSAFENVPELIEIKPEIPVRIKLKRNASGSYSWELNGNDADRILEINKQISDYLKRSES